MYVREKAEQSGDEHMQENVDRIKAFRAVYAHFSADRDPRVKGESKEYLSTPTLEIRKAMQQAKSAYDSMVDIQERLNQAYQEIMKDPS